VSGVVVALDAGHLEHVAVVAQAAGGGALLAKARQLDQPALRL